MSLKRLSDRIPHWAAHITFWDWVFRILYAVGTLTAAWWAAASAYAEGIIEPYGTVGYIAVIGAVVFIAFMLAIGMMALAWSIDRLRHPSGAPQVSGSGPTETATSKQTIGARSSIDRIYHKDESVELYKLVTNASPVLENRTFENCDIVGPAFLLPKNIRFEGKVIFRGSSDFQDFLVEIPADRRAVRGVIECRNCVFIDCAFITIGFIADPPVLDNIRKMFHLQPQATN